MDLNLIKRQGFVEKEGFFMPLIFVDLSIPHAIAVGGVYTGLKSMKKATIAPLNNVEPTPLLQMAKTSPSLQHQKVLLGSIDDVLLL